MSGEVERARPLLDYIARYESGGDYDIVWGGIKAADKPPKQLTKMTIGEVLDWQDRIDSRYMSEAAGRYQIMEDTLRPLYAQCGFNRHTPFHKWTQDRLALELLRRRGWDRFMSGKMSLNLFCNSLAKEWASLPVVTDVTKPNGQTVKAGQSYYAGDGLNKAHSKVKDFKAAVEACVAPVRPDLDEPLTPPEKPQDGWLMMLLEIIRGLFK